MSADTSELDQLAADLHNVPAHMVPKVRAVVARGALNITSQMKRDTQGSTYFAKIGPTINYDLTVGEFAGDASIEASIGPDPNQGGAAQLAGAYYGWSRGGGTLPDPSITLAEEEPRFVQNLVELAGFIFDD